MSDEVKMETVEKRDDGSWQVRIGVVDPSPGAAVVHCAQAAGFAHAGSRLCDMVTAKFVSNAERRGVLKRAQTMFAAALESTHDSIAALGPEPEPAVAALEAPK